MDDGQGRNFGQSGGDLDMYSNVKGWKERMAT